MLGPWVILGKRKGAGPEPPLREDKSPEGRKMRAQGQESLGEATGPLVSGYWEDLQAPGKQVSRFKPSPAGVALWLSINL